MNVTSKRNIKNTNYFIKKFTNYYVVGDFFYLETKKNCNE